jgi:hypothetical protein
MNIGRKKKMVKKLIGVGGKLPSSGAGILSLTLLNEDCICKVNKIDYFTIADSLY